MRKTEIHFAEQHALCAFPASLGQLNQALAELDLAEGRPVIVLVGGYIPEENMNKSNLIWGSICLAIAAGLAVANLTLPPDSLMFSVGNRNMPWVPPIVLGILGAILLANAYRGGEEGMQQPQAQKAVESEKAVDSEKAELNKRLETIFWGLFLIMLGGWTFIPDETIPKGAWSIAVGLLFLGLNAARYFNHIRMSGFTTVLGILSVIGGIADVLGWADISGALLLIILGAYLILKPWFEEKKLFGKAEQS